MSEFNIKDYNTFGLDVNCKAIDFINNATDIPTLLKKYKGEELLILGGGSNVLFTNPTFEGVVIINKIKGFEATEEDDYTVVLKSGSGESWHELVLNSIDQNFGGLENLSFIPGSVGASPMQNIGAYGVEIKDVFESLEAYHLESGEIHTFSNSECEFGYRESVFKRKVKGQYIITSVSFKLSKKNHQLNTSYGIIEQQLMAMNIINPTIKDVSDAVVAIRSSKLPNPKEIGNAGSFFKNPIVKNTVLEKIQLKHPNCPFYPSIEGFSKLAAGWLIEQVGWKGKTINGYYGVHKLQALVIVNYGGATGKELYQLSTQIIEDVIAEFGVELEREVNIIQ